jgi:kinesin family protein C2/C3
MNAESSRSHLIVSVFTNGYNRLTKVTTTGRLNLIDLAGSERISKSCVSGDGLKEAQNINASLSNLGTVIAARANKQAHVPYRNSQLTYLLQDSLDKNSKTLMIVQLSPSIESVGETLCSLRFAARVKEVELGKASASKAISKE